MPNKIEPTLNYTPYISEPTLTISSDNKFTLTSLPQEQIAVNTFYKVEQYDSSFEVIAVDSEYVTVVMIDGKEVIVPRYLFTLLFYKLD